MKVQARTDAAVEILAGQARELEDAGCFSLVVECVPSGVAPEVTDLLKIPTIGIGAGPSVSGKVLNPGFKPKAEANHTEAKAGPTREQRAIADVGAASSALRALERRLENPLSRANIARWARRYIRSQRIPPRTSGRGSVHHIAFRAKDDAEQAEMARKLVTQHNLHPTDQRDTAKFAR